jgi:aminoglycoside phosphotransferase (APT) family kinase protein
VTQLIWRPGSADGRGNVDLVTPEELARGIADVLGVATIANLTRLSGGASRETWSFTVPDTQKSLILQRQRGVQLERPMAREAAVVAAAQQAGVPTPQVIAASSNDDRLGGFLIVTHVEGETIARRIQRDEAFSRARRALPKDFGRALAKLHAIDPGAVEGLEQVDQLDRYREVLDQVGAAHPAFEIAFRWLDANRPAPGGRTVIVHGDFRLGNIIVNHDGLAAVIDWELAHIGDPMEDLGWLCVKAWRFGSTPPVAGIGKYRELFDGYEQASGLTVDPDVVQWWQMLGTLKWGIMCIMQAMAHFTGLERSHELAAIGRRVCENEFDLLQMLPTTGPFPK